MSERVLVFPADILNQLPPIENGFTADALNYGNIIFSNPGLTFIDRDEAENDPNWKQIIPYMLVQYQDSYLVYQRNKSGGESRLHNLFSLGIGGHIKDTDGVGPIDAYLRGMYRELHEEVEIDIPQYPNTLRACLYDDMTDVGKVHFGFVYVMQAGSPNIRALDPAVGIPSYIPAVFIKQQRERFESWSKICIDNLLP